LAVVKKEISTSAGQRDAGASASKRRRSICRATPGSLRSHPAADLTTIDLVKEGFDVAVSPVAQPDSTLTTREAGHLALRAVLRAGLPPAPVEHRISGLRGSSGDTGLAVVALGGSLA
jgi:hypothetical protein